MNKQSIAVKEQAIALKKSRDQCIASVRDLCGSNCEYFSPDKCIYISENGNRHIPMKLRRSVLKNDMPSINKAVKQFRSENPNEKLKIIRV